jgi:N-acyl-D-aspartate/D-glutamate deacylase
MLETLENVEGMNLQTMRAGLDWSFETFPEYVQTLKRLPKRLNVTAYVGHTPLRMYVMGGLEAAQREATDEEIAEMRRLVREAMDAGAVGFSSSQAPSHHGARGLPVPSRMASRKELRALLEEMAAGGRGIAMLTYGLQYEMQELAQISKELGVRISWGSLLTDMFGPPGAAMEMLEEASAIGGDIWPQVSCRYIVLNIRLESPNYLGVAPLFEKEVLGVPRERRAGIYRDQAWRDKARPQLAEYRPGMFERTSIAGSRSHPELVGRPILEVAAERGVDPFDLMLDLSLEDDLQTRFAIPIRNLQQEELIELVQDKRTVLGAHDAGAHVDELCDSMYPSEILGYWVRELGALTLEDAVFRLSGHPATIWRMHDRGFVRPGFAADLVAFDADTVGALPQERVHDFPASGERVIARSTGYEHMWVNGTQTRRDGAEIEGATPGVYL